MNHKFIRLSLLLGFAFLFSGCPVGIDYPAGYPGKEKIDRELIGTWFNDQDEPAVKEVRISKVDEYSMHAEVTQQGSMYSLDATELTGWCTEIGNMKFVYWQPNSNTDLQFYLYAYKIENGKLITYDVSLLDGGVDAVTSVENYRSQIERSLKKTECLTDTTYWQRK